MIFPGSDRRRQRQGRQWGGLAASWGGMILALAVFCQAQQIKNTVCDIGANKLTALLTHLLGYERIVPQTCLHINGVRRCYYTYVPECASHRVKVPIVYNLHAANGCVDRLFKRSGWWQKADRYCFVVVYPLGNTNPNITDFPCWGMPGGNPFLRRSIQRETNTCCCRRNGTKIDLMGLDDEFLLQIAPTVASDLEKDGITVDLQRVYMTGHSSGCIASLAMASLYPDFVAAVCCHSGTMVTPLNSSQAPSSPVPTWMVHGELDETIVPRGSLVQMGPIQSAQRIAESSRYNCTQSVIRETASAKEYHYSGCHQDANVTLLLLNLVGHNAHLAVSPREDNPAVETPQVDTTELAWQFCSSFAQPQAAGASFQRPPCTENPRDRFWYKNRYASCRWLSKAPTRNRQVACTNESFTAQFACPVTCGVCTSTPL